MPIMERGVLARALYTNTPEAKTELYFRKGDIVTVIEFDYENQLGWWLCSLRGQRGICPGNYFELLEDKYSIPNSPILTNAPNTTTTRDGVRDSDSTVSVEDPLETYDVPRGTYKNNSHHVKPSSPSPSLSKVNPHEFYDVPRSHIPIYPGNSSDSLARTKNRQSELSLLSTGSSAHLSSSASSSASSSSASSSARSSTNCDLPSIHQPHEQDGFFQVTPNSSGGESKINTACTEDSISGKSHQEQSSTTNQSPSQPRQQNSSHYLQSNRSSIQSETMVSMAPLQEFYDVPRSAPTSRAQSAMSMSSGLGLSIANSDSKDSLDYDVPRSSGGGGSIHAYVNHIETKYDSPSVSNSCRNSCCSVNSYGKTTSTRESTDPLPPHPGATSLSDNSHVKLSYEIGGGRKNSAVVNPDDLYDVPRSTPTVVARRHPPIYPSLSSINSSLASMSISKESLRSSNNSHKRFNNNSIGSSNGSSLDVRRRGMIQNGQSVDTLSEKFNSTRQLNQSQHSSDELLSIGDRHEKISSTLSLQSYGNKTMTPRSSFCSVRSRCDSFDNVGQERTMEDVKFLPLNPRAAVTVCEKLRQEVITSVNSILDISRPKWRTKENLTEIMPDLRFSCIRFNLAIKDMTDFCSRCVSNARKFTIEALVAKLQRLLSPLINGSQIIQRDVDELEAYFWSVDRLSVSPNESKNLPPDCLDQLVLCARSLKHDVTEIANFLALNSSALFREPERLNPSPPQVTPVVTENSEEPVEDYDYVSLMPMDQVDETDSTAASEVPAVTTTTPYLVSSDQQLLEFYSTQIAATAPLLSTSISTFISSIQQNDPPKTFNGHLKYVILLAYKMLFVGDTVHRNVLNPEIKEEIETKANELHTSVVALHEASRIASRDFPRIPPMQNIVDRIWDMTAKALAVKNLLISFSYGYIS